MSSLHRKIFWCLIFEKNEIMDTTKSAMKYVENKNINGRKGKRIKKMKNKKTQKWNKKESNDKNKEVKVKL